MKYRMCTEHIMAARIYYLKISLSFLKIEFRLESKIKNNHEEKNIKILHL